MSKSEPVVVLMKADDCPHCHNLEKIWNPTDQDPEKNITSAMKKVYPKLRISVFKTAKRAVFDENHMPKGLLPFAKGWYPNVLLVPGATWDAAMVKLGPDNNVEIRDGVQIFNGHWKDGKPELKIPMKYTSKPSEYARWLSDALNEDDFKRVQYGKPKSHEPIAPLMSPFNVPTADLEKPPSTPLSRLNSGKDVCGLRIISRPK